MPQHVVIIFIPTRTWHKVRSKTWPDRHKGVPREDLRSVCSSIALDEPIRQYLGSVLQQAQLLVQFMYVLFSGLQLVINMLVN